MSGCNSLAINSRHVRVRKISPLLLLVIAIILPIRIYGDPSQPPVAQPEVLSLDQCLSQAFQNYKMIQEDEKNVVIAQEGVHQAQGAFLPTFGVSLTSNDSDVSKEIDYSTGALAQDYYTGGVNGTLPIDVSGGRTATLKLAKLKLASTQETLRKDKQTLTYTIINDYYQVWLAEKELGVQQASYNDMDLHFQSIQYQYQAGKASKYDLSQAQVQRDIIKPKILSAMNTLALNKLQLATDVGLPKEQGFTVSYDDSKLQIPNEADVQLDNLLATAYQNRPEMRQYFQNIEMSKVQTQIDAAGYKPNLSISLAYNGNNSNLSTNGWYPYWTLAATISDIFYDGNVTHSKVVQDKTAVEVNSLKEADLRDQIRLGAQQALQNLGNSIEQTRANQSSIDLARETLDMDQTRYTAGLATTIDIMDDEVSLDTYLDNYYEGIVSYLLARANLDLVTGKD